MDTAAWSNTDFPYMCLKDRPRTEAFHRAIDSVVKAGDVVVDVGSGSGILAMFAAAAGAERVYAVEFEPLLAAALRSSIKLNGLAAKIIVVEADILTAKLPRNVDCIIAEIIETGLLDEMQVPALNNLRRRGIITDQTRLLPSRYQTFATLVHADNSYYGYQIMAPKHEWPFYRDAAAGWYQTEVASLSETVEVAAHDFSAGLLDEAVAVTLEFALPPDKKANALKISGLITLCDGLVLGPTNALNGDKIIPLDNELAGPVVKLKLGYHLGRGLGSLRIEQV